MNQAQRNFLIKKIEEKTKTEIKALEGCKPEAPSLSNYLLHAVMSGNFELKTVEHIKEVIRRKALNSKERSGWLNNDRWSDAGVTVSFNANDIFVIPDEYKLLSDEYWQKTKEINNKIRELYIQSETLITRIQLASDKTLQTLINEVDDMGNLSLMDTKMKQITNG